MARIFMLLGALLLVLAPCIGLPQGAIPLQPQPVPAPGWQNAGQWQFPSPMGIGGWGNRQRYQDEFWNFAVNGRIGYQWMRWTSYFPFNSNPDPELQVFPFERMDITLKDGGFWVGYGGVDVQPIPDIVLYGRYGANIPKSSEVEMDASGRTTRPGSPGFGSGANATSPWTWTTWFHWWMLEGGLVWWATSDLGLELGFRTEHIDYRLTDPRNLLESVDRIPPGLQITCNRL
jgi:hypothetical protein